MTEFMLKMVPDDAYIIYCDIIVSRWHNDKLPLNSHWKWCRKHIHTYKTKKLPSLIAENIRILITTIRNLGKCLCLHCLILLNQIHDMGMARDMWQHETIAHMDNMQYCNLVDVVQRAIYEHKFCVNSTAVKKCFRILQCGVTWWNSFQQRTYIKLAGHWISCNPKWYWFSKKTNLVKKSTKNKP